MHQIESENVGKHNCIYGMIQDYDQWQKLHRKTMQRNAAREPLTISGKMAGEAGTSNCSMNSVDLLCHVPC